jgi:hypothetical protein
MGHNSSLFFAQGITKALKSTTANVIIFSNIQQPTGVNIA